MSSAMYGFILLLVFAWTLTRLFYDKAVLPRLRDQARFRLYAIRDELRNVAIENHLAADTFAFRYFEDMLNRMTRMCDVHSVSNLLYFCWTVEIPDSWIADRKRFEAEAPEDVKGLEQTAVRIMMSIMLSNSPMFCVFASAVTVVNGALRRTIEMKNRLLWADEGGMSWPQRSNA